MRGFFCCVFASGPHATAQSLAAAKAQLKEYVSLCAFFAYLREMRLA